MSFWQKKMQISILNRLRRDVIPVTVMDYNTTNQPKICQENASDFEWVEFNQLLRNLQLFTYLKFTHESINLHPRNTPNMSPPASRCIQQSASRPVSNRAGSGRRHTVHALNIPFRPLFPYSKLFFHFPLILWFTQSHVLSN